MKIVLEVPIKVTDQDLMDIISIAFEGGINYWCSDAEKLGNLSYKLYDSESDDTWTFDKDDLLRGIKQYMQNNHEWKIFDTDENGLYLEFAYIDADVADQIIQYACMGKVIFG